MDVVRQTVPLFEKVRIIGSDTGTSVDAYTEDMHVFLEADLVPAPELAGAFGVSNLSGLKKLFDSAIYKSDEAEWLARRTARGDEDFVSELVFRDGHGGQFRFQTISPKLMIPQRPKLKALKWTVAVEPSRAKINELIELAGMLVQFEQSFSVKFDGNTLLLHIGSRDGNGHSATVPVASDGETGALPTSSFCAKYLVTLLKTVGTWPLTVRFAPEDGVAGLLIKTDHGSYNYVLRGRD